VVVTGEGLGRSMQQYTRDQAVFLQAAYSLGKDGKGVNTWASSSGPDVSQVSPRLNRAMMTILLYEQCSTIVTAQDS